MSTDLLPPPEADRPSLLGASRQRLATILEPVIDRPFRVDQIYRALYERGVTDFAAMTELGKDLRQALAEHFTIALPEVSARHSSADGTVKFLLQLADGSTIETVDIPDGERHTLCISSQAGCALACRFCVTGYWGGGRDLTAGEILGQIFAAQRWPRGTEPSSLNLVFMGMGEPLLNLANLEEAHEMLLQRLSWRRITVSTAGVIPGIEALAKWPRRPHLAISLHASDDDRRSAIMPINKKYPLKELIGVLSRYPLAPKQRLTFEYLLIDGFNDSLADADDLVRLLHGLRAKVNLIPFNADPILDPSFAAPSEFKVRAFQKRLRDRGLLTTRRRRRGDDVSAACGQLRTPDRTPRGYRPGAISL